MKRKRAYFILTLMNLVIVKIGIPVSCKQFQLRYLFNPSMPSRLFYHNSLDRSISYISGVWLFLYIIIKACRNSEPNAV